ncbi:hypothetical protein [Los Azufres archaeal virus 1]|nr:hypothetical protein [Los Azufres archaeal virus 1]
MQCNQIANFEVTGASLGVFYTKSIQITVNSPGYYQALISTFNTLDGSISYQVLVNGNQVLTGSFSVYLGIVTGAVNKLLDIGGLNSGDQLVIKLSFSGSWAGWVVVNFGFLAPGEFASMATALGIPILSNFSQVGVLVSEPAQQIQIYQIANAPSNLRVFCLYNNVFYNVTEALQCLNNPASCLTNTLVTITKTIPFSGTPQPGLNTITITAAGPLSSSVLSTLNNALPNGQTINGVTIVSKSISGNTLTITVDVPQAQGILPAILGIVEIAVLIIAIAIAISIVYVSVTNASKIATGVSAGIGVAIAALGIGVAAAVGFAIYQHMKGR